MKKLYKTTIVIWSEYDPATGNVDLDDLARDACDGESYCSRMESVAVENPKDDEDWDGTEFFGTEDEIYCDHCGEPLEDEGNNYSELPFDVSSANKGESGVLCDDCNERLSKQLTVCCVGCGKDVPADEAHLHQGDYWGECCWDERLKSTE